MRNNFHWSTLLPGVVGFAKPYQGYSNLYQGHGNLCQGYGNGNLHQRVSNRLTKISFNQLFPSLICSKSIRKISSTLILQHQTADKNFYKHTNLDRNYVEGVIGDEPLETIPILETKAKF